MSRNDPSTAVFRSLRLPEAPARGSAKRRKGKAATRREDDTPPPRTARKRGGIMARLAWWTGATVICAGMAVAGFATGGIAAWLHSSTPIPAMDLYDPPEMTALLDASGSEFSRLFEEQRRVIPLADLPSRLPEAYVAIEDTNFYHHVGVDPRGLLRATLTNAQRGRMDQGASTITQQLARNIVDEVGRERSLERKAREAFNALRMERHYTKDQILEVYLNHIYLGSGTYGVEAAAQAYFGRSAADLDLAQIALLAGLPQLPERYSPLNDPDRARTRRNQVLARMNELGWITDRQYEDALDAPVLEDSALAFRSTAAEDRYFADAVRRELTQTARLDVQRLRSRGYRVETTLDRGLQRAAVEALRAGIDAEEAHWVEDRQRRWQSVRGSIDDPPLVGQRRMARVVRHFPGSLVVELGGGWRADLTVPEGAAHLFSGSVLSAGMGVDIEIKGLDRERRLFRGRLLPDKGLQGALVAIDRQSGEVRAIAGGRDWADRANDGFFNRATSARRQAGSTLKPLFLAAALEAGFRPSTIVQDYPMTFANGYRPRNYENRFHGAVPLQETIEQSHNASTIWTVREVGLRRSIAKVREFDRIDGEESWHLPNEVQIVLGSTGVTPMELAMAYQVFANGGVATRPTTVRAVSTAGGRPLRLERREASRLLQPEEAAAMNQMLLGVMTHGTGRRVREQLPAELRDRVAGKTGTTNDNRDAWFTGFTPDHVVVAWIGFDVSVPLGSGRTGGVVAGPVWADFVTRSWELGHERGNFPIPDGYTLQLADRAGGHPVDPANAAAGGRLGWKIVESHRAVNWTQQREREARDLIGEYRERYGASLPTPVPEPEPIELDLSLPDGLDLVALP